MEFVSILLGLFILEYFRWEDDKSYYRNTRGSTDKDHLFGETFTSEKILLLESRSVQRIVWTFDLINQEFTKIESIFDRFWGLYIQTRKMFISCDQYEDLRGLHLLVNGFQDYRDNLTSSYYNFMDINFPKGVKNRIAAIRNSTELMMLEQLVDRYYQLFHSHQQFLHINLDKFISRVIDARNYLVKLKCQKTPSLEQLMRPLGERPLLQEGS